MALFCGLAVTLFLAAAAGGGGGGGAGVAPQASAPSVGSVLSGRFLPVAPTLPAAGAAATAGAG